MIGDLVRFVNKENCEIVISGRTKHFLSLVGEHLSVDNMNKAVEYVAEQLNVEIPEFTVAGIPYEGSFAHHWFLGVNGNLDRTQAKLLLDKKLKELNDDYAVERVSALKEVIIDTLPAIKFYNYMSNNGRLGGQNKFPRVLKASQLEEWKQYISS